MMRRTNASRNSATATDAFSNRFTTPKWLLLQLIGSAWFVAGLAGRPVTPGLLRLPEWATISIIEPSPFDAGTAYVVADAHRLDDMRPYLYKTTDYGKTWRSAGLEGAIIYRLHFFPEVAR